MAARPRAWIRARDGPDHNVGQWRRDRAVGFHHACGGGRSTTGSFLLGYGDPAVTSQTVPVLYSVHGRSNAPGNRDSDEHAVRRGKREGILAVDGQDGSADKIQVSFTNTGLYAGVKLDQSLLRIQFRDEVQQLNFSFINAQTAGSFTITSSNGDLETWHGPRIRQPCWRAFSRLTRNWSKRWRTVGHGDGNADVVHAVPDHVWRRAGRAESASRPQCLYRQRSNRERHSDSADAGSRRGPGQPVRPQPRFRQLPWFKMASARKPCGCS